MALSLIRPPRVYPPRDDTAVPHQGPARCGKGPNEAELKLDKQASQETAVPTTPMDVDMDGLVENMESSLQFVPKGVRKRQNAKTPATNLS